MSHFSSASNIQPFELVKLKYLRDSVWLEQCFTLLNITEAKKDFVGQQSTKEPGIPSLIVLGGGSGSQHSKIKQFDDVVI